MKRSPLKRGKPLQRKTRLRARGKTKYRRRERDLPYMKLVKRLPCFVRVFLGGQWSDDVLFGALVKAYRNQTPCSGRVQADHLGVRAYGHKSPDGTCGPMCFGHHGERTDLRGTFKDFTKVEMRAFCDAGIAHTQRQVSRLREKVA